MPEKLRIALAPGDGIGPEIMRAVLAVFDAAGVMGHIEFVPVEMGRAVFEAGETRGMTDAAIATVESCGLLFKGPMETPKGGGGKSINVTARKLWGAFANLRHFQSLPGVETVYSRAGIPVNFYVVRENVEDTYGGIEHRVTPDVAECRRIISAPGSDQVCRFAFTAARRLGINRVTCGHKANIMKITDGLFLERFRAVAADHPDIEHEDVIIDALCMNLVLRPHLHQMVVLPNLQGDIVSDLAAGLVGGLGFAPSANIGEHISIFEAVHGTAPDIAGRGVANPTSLLLSGLMMLRHVGLLREANIIENAFLATLESGIHTGDFGDRSTAIGTMPFAEAIITRLSDTPPDLKKIKPLPIPPAAAPSLTRPQRPHAHRLLRTFHQVVAQDAGCDVTIETTEGVPELAAQLERLCESTPFRLTLLSSRGTRVWPTGSVYTETVDEIRARFEPRDPSLIGSFGQSPAIRLLNKISERYRVADFVPLRRYDGKQGYSMAQGQ